MSERGIVEQLLNQSRRDAVELARRKFIINKLARRVARMKNAQATPSRSCWDEGRQRIVELETEVASLRSALRLSESASVPANNAKSELNSTREINLKLAAELKEATGKIVMLNHRLSERVNEIAKEKDLTNQLQVQLNKIRTGATKFGWEMKGEDAICFRESTVEGSFRARPDCMELTLMSGGAKTSMRIEPQHCAHLVAFLLRSIDESVPF